MWFYKQKNRLIYSNGF